MSAPVDALYSAKVNLIYTIEKNTHLAGQRASKRSRTVALDVVVAIYSIPARKKKKVANDVLLYFVFVAEVWFSLQG